MDSKKTVGKYIAPRIPMISCVVAVKFIGSVAELFLPFLLSYMVDSIAPEKNVRKMFLFGGIMILCSLVALIANILANRRASKTASEITSGIRHDLYEKTLSLSCKKTEEFTTPTLISRLTSDTYHFHNMLLMVQRLGVRAPILVIGGVIITSFLDPVLTLILLLLMPIVFISVFFISKKGVKLFGQVQKSTDDMVGMLREHMDGIRVIKALSKSEYERDRFEKINESIYESDKKAATVMGLSSPVMSLLLNLGLVLAIVIGSFRVRAGLIQAGVIIAFLSYFTIILNAMMMITRMFMNLSKGLASAKRLNEVFTEDNESETLAPHPATLSTDAHIVFKDVSFSYLGAKDNLHSLSFEVDRGGSLGIIGSTGSGKTTAISLLLRLYQTSNGQIYINGENILGIEREKLYRMFGFALQTDFLMSDTIEENIRFGRNISDAEIEQAAHDALAHKFICEKDGAYGHMLNIKASNLSGGQKQRMLIARALAGKPDILILDDSSGGLDYKTDSLLRANIRKNYTDCTKIFVAQRVATIKDCDRIIVLDRGRVVGDGTHEALMQSCELYRQTAKYQMNL